MVGGKSEGKWFGEVGREGSLPSPRAGMSAPVLSLKVLVAIVVVMVVVVSCLVLFLTAKKLGAAVTAVAAGRDGKF